MGAPIVHFEILAEDSAAMARFYGELFDWQISTDNPMQYGVVAREDNLNADGIGIGGGVAAAPPGTARLVTVYAEVPDVEAALARAEALGGTRLLGPETPMAGLTVGQFTDPEGNVLGVIQADAP